MCGLQFLIVLKIDKVIPAAEYYIMYFVESAVLGIHDFYEK